MILCETIGFQSWLFIRITWGALEKQKQPMPGPVLQRNQVNGRGMGSKHQYFYYFILIIYLLN